MKLFTVAFRKIYDAAFNQIPPNGDLAVNPSDSWGNSLANGIYYVEVTTPTGGPVVKKLLIFR